MIDQARNTETSARLFQNARELFPGGVNSPVRAFRSVGGDPLFIQRGEGAWVVDADGNRYIDHVLSWGPLVLGHAHPVVIRAIADAARRGTSFGAPTTAEIELATEIRTHMPGLERLRMVNSGTEAVMSAIRVGRAFTGRPKIVKFAGCYHGHADLLLVQAGSGVATLSLPDSPGVPPQTVEDTLIARYNDAGSVESLFREHPDQIAAVIVEPVAGNMGLVLPEEDFLPALRLITREHGALLILDEVMTGFRVAIGGAQSVYGIEPDLTTLGKVIGGGLPVGAFGGRREIMDLVAPEGPVYQAGTLSGNPVAMNAGLATLRELCRPGVQESLARSSASLAEALREAAERHGIALQSASAGSMFGFFFADTAVRDWDGAAACNRDRFTGFFRGMLDRGVYLAPSPFEAAFVSTAHGEAEIRAFADAADGAMAALPH